MNVCRARWHFDFLLTVDQHIAEQQNLAQFRIAVVAIATRSNRLADLRPFVPQILEALRNARMGSLT